MDEITETEIVRAADIITGGNVRALSLAKLQELMAISQYVRDSCVGEIERRASKRYFMPTRRQ